MFFPPWMRFDDSDRITSGFIDPFVEVSHYHVSSCGVAWEHC